MTSRAESIAQAVVTALTTPAMSAVPAARVYRDVDDALNAGLFPVVIVDIGDEPDPQRVLIPLMDREVEIGVTVVASGANPYAAADAAVVETFARIVADRTLGGLALDILEGGTRRGSAAMAEHSASVRKSYRVQYRTSQDSLEA